MFYFESQQSAWTGVNEMERDTGKETQRQTVRDRDRTLLHKDYDCRQFSILTISFC